MNFSLTAKRFQLPLKDPFTTSRYTVNVQETIIVSISDGVFIGYGEATANPFYGSTIEQLEQSITSSIEIVEQANGVHPSVLWNQLQKHLYQDYFALCAIDCAYWDWYAKSKRKPLRRFWSHTDDNNPLSNYTIGIDAISVMKAKIMAMPWPIYKIKLGTTHDLGIISDLRKITSYTFRIDANCAWTAEETIANSIALKKLNVEFIEQPLKKEDREGMKYVKAKSVLPIIADESCQKEEDLNKCGESFHGINIKLMKCGGITPALRMIQNGRNMGLKIMAGCMTESSIGISNLAQLAPLLDFIDADGAMLLKNDIAEGVKLVAGRLIFSPENGSGSHLKN